jgi:hypothetical protein
MNREYGVRVAHIAGVCFAGMEAAIRGHRQSSGAGCNRSRINDLEKALAGPKKSKYLHKYVRGEKVKAFTL